MLRYHLSCIINYYLFLGEPGDMLSARVYRECWRMEIIINLVFLDERHCEKSYRWQVLYHEQLLRAIKEERMKDKHTEHDEQLSLPLGEVVTHGRFTSCAWCNKRVLQEVAVRSNTDDYCSDTHRKLDEARRNDEQHHPNR